MENEQERVIAIQSASREGIVDSYGEGVIVPNQIPDVAPFNMLNAKNPCILLASGQYIWGFQCWWGPKDRMDKKLAGYSTINIVSVDHEVKPIEKEEDKDSDSDITH